MQRRRVEGGQLFHPEGYPSTMPGMSGIGRMSVIDAAAMDGEDIPYWVSDVSIKSGAHDRGRGCLIELMESCLHSDPGRRPSLPDIQSTLRSIVRPV